MSLVSLDVQALGLDRVIADLDATAAQADKALASTLVRMAGWLKARSVKGLSKELAIQQKVVRRRLKSFRVKRSPSGSSITIWYGLDPVALIYLGARETGTGVTAGKHKRQGAFIARGKNGGSQVFKRTGKSRLPLEKQVLDVNDKAATYLEDSLIGGAEFEAQFYKTFERELQWRTRTPT